MSHRVIIQPTAFDDLDETLTYLTKHYSSATAAAWYDGCLAAIESLAENPERCSRACESEKLGVEIRQLLYRRHSERLPDPLHASREFSSGALRSPLGTRRYDSPRFWRLA